MSAAEKSPSQPVESGRVQSDAYDRSVDRWARWLALYDRLPRPIRRLVPRRYL